MKKFSSEFIKAALIRAVRTGAQAALSLITVGVGVFDVDWKTVLGISATSMIASLLTSIVTDLPETSLDGVIPIDGDSAIAGAKVGDIVRFKLIDGEDGGLEG